MIGDMFKPHFPTAKTFFDDAIAFFPPGLIISVAAGCVEHGKYFRSAYAKEFIGTVLMVLFTFSAGKWVGQDDVNIAWSVHAVGVVLADYFGGGQQVNPAVTVSMWSLGKITYTEGFVRIAGQMGGGLVAFPLAQYISETLSLTPFGGPECCGPKSVLDQDADAFSSEFVAMFLLMWAIYILNWEMNFGSYHYIIKQTLTAFAIRGLIEYFPAAGPAMNPMLATTWYVFGVNKNTYPNDTIHYFVYWFGPCLAGIFAGLSYILYDGQDKLFGKFTIPIGPIKSITKSSSSSKAKKD